MSQSVEGTVECRICCGASDGTHFGVESCRACAAFFRRTIVSKRNYVCRSGGNKCKVNKSARMCRSCRIAKCFRMGMRTEQVQNRPVTEADLVEEHDVHDLHAYNSPSTSSSISTTAADSNSMDCLNKVLINYRHMAAVQRSTEYSLLQENNKNVFVSVIVGNDASTQPANFDLFCKMARSLIPTVGAFLKNSYSGFEELENAEKWFMYRKFIPPLWILQSAYYSKKMLKDDAEKTMFTQTTYIDRNNTASFYENCVPPVAEPQQLGILWKNATDKKLPMIKLMRKIDITEIELAALISLTFWDHNLGVNNDKILCMADRERTAIFADLHTYYRTELKLDNYAIRLGELMCIFSSIQFNVNGFNEDLELFNLMGLFKNDSFIYERVKHG